MIPPSTSLVKYDNPVLITRVGEKKSPKAKSFSLSPREPDSTLPGQATSSKGPDDIKAETQEILNQLLPPREWEEEGKLWLQQVSTTPATRLDVLNLQEQLDMKLQQRQARETGICPIRRELYTQAFDELIRQVTINCTERGLLLLRVRDEIRTTIAAYQTLYESSSAFGLRKALQAEESKVTTEAHVVKLEDEKIKLEQEILDLRGKVEQVEKRANEQRQVDEKKHAEEIQFLKRTNQQLKAQLEGIIAPKK